MNERVPILNKFMIKWKKIRGSALLIKCSAHNYIAKSPFVLLSWTLYSSVTCCIPTPMKPLINHLFLDYNNCYYPYLHTMKMKLKEFASCPWSHTNCRAETRISWVYVQDQPCSRGYL